MNTRNLSLKNSQSRGTRSSKNREESSARVSPKFTTSKRTSRARATTNEKENNHAETSVSKGAKNKTINKKLAEKNESPVRPKRRRIVIPDENSDEDSETDYKPDPDEAMSDSGDSGKNISSESEAESDCSPTPKKKAKRVEISRRTVKATNTVPKTVSQIQVPQENPPSSERSNTWPHLTYEFLKRENIRDANNRRPDDPDYNPRTLHVPEQFMNKQTPAMRQWWVLKSQHYDCVLLFKVGGFYELYHMDAVIGVNELSLSYKKEDWAHAGFLAPGHNYARYSAILVDKGYSVARVEQTETPEMVQERCSQSKSTKFDKVINREICQITNRAIRVPTVHDGEILTPESSYLMSLVEKIFSPKISKFGICFIDTSTGVFHLSQFEDDLSYSRLLTLLSHYNPTQVIYERGGLSETTMKILNDLPSVTKEALQREVEFWSATKTLKNLRQGQYFSYESSEFAWPERLKPFLNLKGEKGPTPAKNAELAINALGGCISILKQFRVEEQLLALKNFQAYVPPDLTGDRASRQDMLSNMVLDAITVKNLNILGNMDSLNYRLDHTCTPFGKRLLKEWVCRPSCQKEVIVSRQNAITELLERPGVVQAARKIMSELPDLERLLSKIHAYGNAARMNNHPDGRAVLYDSPRYATKKIEDFIAVLQAFEKVWKIHEKFKSFECELIKNKVRLSPEGKFPDFKKALERFKNGFDHEEARKVGYIVPKKGMDKELDEIAVELDMICDEAEIYLKKQSKHFGVKIKFSSGNDKKRYQIEVPEDKIHLTTSEHELQSQRKGFKRYLTPELQVLAKRNSKLIEKRENILADVNRRTFANFSTSYDMWCSAIASISVLDVLMSLAESIEGNNVCIPEFVDSKEALLVIKQGKHPCVTAKDFVPNDTILGTEGNASLVIVTGPNMGGKSTLMRQVGLLSVMAQIGCHIPAESCKLTMVDRVFTRLGAGDDILTSRSTFLVELTETSVILKHATKNSLVLLDELGRGTSTYDGTAIAAAVANALTKVHCRTLFSTHYHTLVEDFKKDPNVSLAHMACQVETEEENVSEETVTFLYKFVEGDCPKSYGFNAARLAGVPPEIIKRAHEIADQLERETNHRKLFVKLWKASPESVKSLIRELNGVSM